jgi:hypothetical protein
VDLTFKSARLKVTGYLQKTASSKLLKYNLDIVAVQVERWVEGGSQPADGYTFFYGNGNTNHHLGKGFYRHQ